jgi:putative tryptophan/tyrosine transport system substrate-binding protein
MKRREFITVLGGMAAWPLAAHAQQLGKLVSIGCLVAGTPASHSQWYAILAQRLRELGWIEDRNLTLAYRWTEGRDERAAEFAAEFVGLKVDVIVTNGNAAAAAAKRATSVIPIVFTLVGDPMGTGLVTSLARPGGNVTGLSLEQADIGSKRLGLLRELIPGLRRLAILANIGSPGAVLEMGKIQSAARALGFEVVTSEIRRMEDIAPAFESLKGRVEALYVVGDPLVTANATRIQTLAMGVRLPTIFSARLFVQAGGLISYGPNFPDLFRRSAELVDKILRGTKPGDIPVEQPTKFDLVVNLTTAKALGVTIPESFLSHTDEVIE